MPALGQILSSHGSELLRVKGLINVAGTVRPQVIQCVLAVAYPSLSLPAWPREGPFRDVTGMTQGVPQGDGSPMEEGGKMRWRSGPEMLQAFDAGLIQDAKSELILQRFLRRRG